LLAAAAGTAAVAGSRLLLPTTAIAQTPGGAEPRPINPLLTIEGASFRVGAPATDFGDENVEPSTITDFNGIVGLAYVNGMVTRTNMSTGQSQMLPFVESDMRFMQGLYRAMDGQVRQGTFGFI
jgi:hypothetical protein